MDATNIATLLNLRGYGRGAVLSTMKNTSFNPTTMLDLMDIIQDASKHNGRLIVPDLSELESARNKAISAMHICDNNGIFVLGIEDPAFPVRLKKIPSPPVLLFVKGNKQALHEELSVAIIGTREPSEYGKICGERFGKIFAEKGLVVTSGLAKGIDAQAHQGCINGGGKTIALLAHGLDVPVYPKENRDLANEILESGGSLVSEYTLGVRSQKNFFVERDRLQSGLSAGVVVIETDIKGGTMHTVGYCVEQNKPLGCLNHPEKFQVGNEKCRGNQKLIREGKASALFGLEDIDNFILRMEKTSDIKEIQKEPVTKKTDGGEQLQLFF